MASAEPLEGLETEVGHPGCQLGLCDQAPGKPLNTRAWGNTAGANLKYIQSHMDTGSNRCCSHSSLERGRLEACTWSLPGCYLLCLLPVPVLICSLLP